MNSSCWAIGANCKTPHNDRRTQHHRDSQAIGGRIVAFVHSLRLEGVREGAGAGKVRRGGGKRCEREGG